MIKIEDYAVRIDHFRLDEWTAKHFQTLDRTVATGKILFNAMSVTELRTGKRTISPTGGMTVAQVYGDDGLMLAEGVAVCSPHDNFNKKIGRNIATGRAFKSLRPVRG